MEPGVARQQSIRMVECVTTDEKVREHPFTGTAARAIRPPIPTRCEGGIRRHRAKFGPNSAQGCNEFGGGIEESGEFGPNCRANENAALKTAASHRFSRHRAEHWVAAENIDQYARINSGDHRGS